MSTGYTHGIEKGTVTEFPYFAFHCARATKYLAGMRDYPDHAPIPLDVEPKTDFYRQRLEEDIATLNSVVSWDKETADSEAHNSNLRSLKGYLQTVRHQRVVKARYEGMLFQVEAWEPPTEEHEELKDFMREQLVSSIEHDTYYLLRDPLSPETRPKKITGEEYREMKIATLSRQIGSHVSDLFGAEDRTEQRNEWVRELYTSLESWHPAVAPAHQIS